MQKATENKKWSELFETEYDCRKHLYKLRFPNGHKCPRCQNEKSYETKEGTYKCSQCKYKMSVRRGTVFERSKLKLKQWYQAIYYTSSSPTPGKVTTKAYQQELGLKSNHSAADVKKVIGDALKQKGSNKLSGNIEVCIKSVVIAKASRSLVLAGEVDGRKVQRCRGRVYINYPTDLSAFLAECVIPGAKINLETGIGDINTVENLGYIWGQRRSKFIAGTIGSKFHLFENAVRNCPDLITAQKAIDELCAEINSEYEPTSFDELLKLVVELPSKSIESKKRTSE